MCRWEISSWSRPGRGIPLDGKVVFRNSMVDTSALTGESVPRKVAGDDIISGCVNGSGLLQVQVTKEFDDSTVAKILELVENASSKKPMWRTSLHGLPGYYTPLVGNGGRALAVIPPLFLAQSWSEGCKKGLYLPGNLLPCALVISVPMSFSQALALLPRGVCSSRGSNYLELCLRWIPLSLIRQVR